MSRTAEHLDLLLVVTPLLQVLGGDKRERLRRAFIGSANHIGTLIMNTEEGRLPGTAREAALELHKAVLDLCMRHGVSRRDLVEHFNEHAESSSYANGSVGEASERALALLAIFHARGLTQGEAT